MAACAGDLRMPGAGRLRACGHFYLGSSGRWCGLRAQGSVVPSSAKWSWLLANGGTQGLK